MTLTHNSEPAASDLPRRWAVLTVENALYLALLGLALFLRLYTLGAHPLNDPEAREALTALRFLRGQADAGLPASPAYFFFTYFGFLVLGDSAIVARLAPAVFGSLLVLLPWLFRDALGRGPALLVGGLLAVSSGMVAASRSADGTVIALFALGLGLGLLRQFAAGGGIAWLIGGALALGLGLAGGGSFLTGLLVTALLAIVVVRSQLSETLDLSAAARRLSAERLTFLVALGLGVLLVATVGLTYRSGLGALANGWLRWLLGFAITAQTGRSVLTIPIFLLVYEPLLLVFGLIGAVRAFRQNDVAGQILAGFALIAAMFAVFYTGRTLFDVVWIVAPLAALAARAIAGLLSDYAVREEWPLAAALTGILLALLSFSGINVIRFVEQARLNPALQQIDLGVWLGSSPSLVLAGLALVVAGLVTYLFAAGWSTRAALAGLTATGALSLLMFTLGAGWGLTQVRPADPAEPWWERPVADDLGRLVETLTNVSNYSVGQEREIVVTVQAEPDGALAWALRDFSKAQFVQDLGAFVSSPVVIAPVGQQNPTLGSAYVGQSFALRHFWFPGNLFWHEQLDWLASRQAPTESERIILWVRQDIQQLQSAQTP